LIENTAVCTAAFENTAVYTAPQENTVVGVYCSYLTILQYVLQVSGTRILVCSIIFPKLATGYALCIL
jgi:hypothetical protein